MWLLNCRRKNMHFQLKTKHKKRFDYYPNAIDALLTWSILPKNKQRLH